MTTDVTILIAEDDEGHFSLIKKNLMRAGVYNEIVRFMNGQEVMDFLCKESAPDAESPKAYLLILDIRMPKVDGLKVLEAIKADEKLKRIPVIMLTTTDDPVEVQRCYELGCGLYIVKPVEYDGFVDAIRKVGQFLSIASVPCMRE
jgi:CheY-like chemotaxis protein